MNYQNYPQYPQPSVDPRAYEQACQTNQALKAENFLLKDKLLGQNWLNQQRDLAREERSAAKKDIAHRSGAKIVKIDGKLCLTSPVGRPYPLMNCAPSQTFYVVPDPLYQVEPYYVLKFENIDSPVFLRLSTVKNDKAFIHALTQATGESMDLQKLYRRLMNKGRVERIEAEHQPKGLSAKTVRNINQVISSALDFAVAQKIISENPCKAVALPKIEHREMQTIPAEQLQAFLAEARATLLYSRGKDNRLS